MVGVGGNVRCLSFGSGPNPRADLEADGDGARYSGEGALRLGSGLSTAMGEGGDGLLPSACAGRLNVGCVCAVCLPLPTAVLLLWGGGTADAPMLLDAFMACRCRRSSPLRTAVG